MEEFLTDKMAISYFVLVVAILLLLAYIIHRRLDCIEQTRKTRLSKIKPKNLLAWGINKNIDKDEIKTQSLNSLERRFSVTRRALYLILLSIAFIVGVVPLIGSFSPALISVMIASVSVILGIAARPFIENMICGLVLSFGKLARIGDVVLVDGEYGTIEDVTLTHCIVRRWDWLRYVIPNSLMMTKEFVNYSLRDNHRWVHVEFWIDNSSDLDLVEKLVKECPKKSPYFSGREEPRFWVVELTPESAKCMAVVWATSAADGWMLSVDMRKELLKTFKQQGIQTHVKHIKLDNDQQR